MTNGDKFTRLKKQLAGPMLYDAAILALKELKQMHAAFYCDCSGGCPAYEAIEALEKAIEYANTGGVPE